jgi:methyl-accepting chemotaxis protein
MNYFRQLLNRFFDLSIGIKVTATIVILIILVEVIIVSIGNGLIKQSLDQLTITKTEGFTQIFDAAIVENTTLAEDISSNDVIKSALAQGKMTRDAEEVIDKLAVDYKYVDQIEIVNADGKILYSPYKTARIGDDLTASNFLITRSLLGAAIEGVLNSSNKGDAYSSALPIVAGDKVVGAVYTASYLVNIFTLVNANGLTQAALFLGQGNDVVYSPFTNLLSADKAMTQEFSKLQKPGGDKIEEVVVTATGKLYTDENGSKWAYIIKPIFAGKDYVGSYILFSPTKDTAAIHNRAILIFLIVSITLAVVSILLAVWISRLITQPIGVIANNMKAIAEGNYEARPNIQYNDEIGQMSKEMNTMLDTISKYLQTEQEYKSFQNNLRDLMIVAADIADGDLVSRRAKVTQDQLGALADSFNLMANELQDVIKQIQGITVTIDDKTHNIVEPISELTTIIENEVDKINKIAKTIQGIANDIKNIMVLTENIRLQSDNSIQIARDGKTVLGESVKGTNLASSQIEVAAGKMANFTKIAYDIIKVSNVISEIAEQTNVLALNASLEATRAGEQGKGFAVVADEIRSLADNTNQSAQTISSMIKNITRETQDLLNAITEANKSMKENIESSQKAQQSLEDIMSANENLALQIRIINDTVKNQSDKAIGISQDILALSEDSEKVAGIFKKSASDISELPNEVENLNKYIKRFKVS